MSVKLPYKINSEKPLVIVPAYNEVATIEKVIQDLAKLRRKGIIGHVLVVDDGSKDKTGELALRAGADVVLKLKNNHGKAMAFYKGLAYYDRTLTKKQLSSAKLITLDADLGGVNAQNISDLTRDLGKSKKIGEKKTYVGMVVGNIAGAAKQFSGQRGFMLRDLNIILHRPQLAQRLLGSGVVRGGFGLELFLNNFFTGGEYLNSRSMFLDPNQGNIKEMRVKVVNTKLITGLSTLRGIRPGRTDSDSINIAHEIREMGRIIKNRQRERKQVAIDLFKLKPGSKSKSQIRPLTKRKAKFIQAYLANKKNEQATNHLVPRVRIIHGNKRH